MDIVERLLILLSAIEKTDEMKGAIETVEDAADEIKRLREAIQDIALGRVGCNIVDAPSWLKEKE